MYADMVNYIAELKIVCMDNVHADPVVSTFVKNIKFNINRKFQALLWKHIRAWILFIHITSRVDYNILNSVPAQQAVNNCQY